MSISRDDSIHHFDCDSAARPSKGICVAADDFGLNLGVNQASLNLALTKRLSAIGCMVGAPSWGDGSKLLEQTKLSHIDIGLHLDFTEYPLRPKSRCSLIELIARCYTGLLNPVAMREEICAQLDAFEDAMNRQPMYVDGHQHIHQLPVISNLLLEELSRRYATNSIWLRSTLVNAVEHRPSFVKSLEVIKPRVIASLGGKRFADSVGKAGFQCNRRLFGVYDFTDSQNRYRAFMKFWLKNVQRGDLLMCHPSLNGNANDSISAARVAEYSYLNSDAFKSDLDQFDCQVASLSSI
jgi:chitin disaccharide deacetylase